jgi:hypothetical protein
VDERMLIHKLFNKNGHFKKGDLWGRLIERKEDLRRNYQVESRLRWARFLAMRSTFIAVLVGCGFLLVSSCASVPTGPLAEGEVRLLSVQVPGSDVVRVSIPFVVNINFQAEDEPEIKRACFVWSGDGPYCVSIRDKDYVAAGKIQVQTKNPGTTISGSHTLECYVQYIYKGKTITSNVVNTHILLRLPPSRIR